MPDKLVVLFLEGRCHGVDWSRHDESNQRLKFERFLTDAQARLDWLENIVRTQLPDVDLSSAPRKPEEPLPGADNAQNDEENDEGRVLEPTNTTFASSSSASGTKRGAEAVGLASSGPALKSARRMAMDLGLFSLHPNASQAHYLGSSSGSLFANLMRLSDPSYLDNLSGTADDSSDVETEGENEALREGGRDNALSHSHSQGEVMIKFLQDNLPQRSECDRLAKGFFSHYHPEYPILHQPSFKSMVDALYASAQSRSDADFQHNGWPADVPVFKYNDGIVLVAGKAAIAISIKAAAAQLLFVLSIASHLRARKRSFNPDAGKFTGHAMSLFQLSLGEVTVPSVQLIVLCVLQEFLTSEGGSLWILIHIAMSFAVDLGLHRCHPISVHSSALAVHLRRRTFLTLYSLERSVCPREIQETRLTFMQVYQRNSRPSDWIPR